MALQRNKLGNYLPLSFKSPKEQEYIEFLWDAFETNYSHAKNQFAFLGYHMLAMSLVYFNIWQIERARLVAYSTTKLFCIVHIPV